jgi:S1-C subfamily serine protease
VLHAPSKDGNKVIASNVDSTGPAMRRGMQPGDIFVEVDGVQFDDGRETPNKLALFERGWQGSRVGVVAECEGRSGQPGLP